MGLLPQKKVQPFRVAGRLRMGHFVETWKVLTNDPWVLKAIKGFSIPFVSLPCQSTLPEYIANITCVSPREDSSSKGGSPVPTGEGSCSSCVIQSGRLLFKPLPGNQEEWSNETSDQPKAVKGMSICRALQDGGNLSLRDLMRPGDWFVKADLKYAYFTTPIGLSH